MTQEQQDDIYELQITHTERYLMDQNILNSSQFAHITRLVINDVIPSLIHGPHGLHTKLQFPPNLTHLTYTNSLMDKIPTGLPDTLLELDISGNRVRQLSGLPPNLTILTFNNNNVEDLSCVPDSVTEIYGHNNPLSKISSTPLPHGLKVLACCYGEITELPQLPDTVTRLACMENKNLSKLPGLSPGMVHLLCTGCNLLELPSKLPESLTELWCDNNQLRELPSQLPIGLLLLKCESNLLTSLPTVLPAGLINLVCGNNQLTWLPELPPTLELLTCESNRLTWLPELSTGLVHLNCRDNMIMTFASSVPDTLQWLDCKGNTDLYLLPPLSLDMICLRLATINLEYGNSVYDNVSVTADMIPCVNKTHWKRQCETAIKRLAMYRTELLERHLEITLNPDRIFRLIKNGELGEPGTWSEF